MSLVTNGFCGVLQLPEPIIVASYTFKGLSNANRLLDLIPLIICRCKHKYIVGDVVIVAICQLATVIV